MIQRLCSEVMLQKEDVVASFGMISNGSFEADHLIPVLQEFGMNISLSVDGFQDSHDKTRFQVKNGVRVGSWRKLAENVEILSSHQLRPYFLYTVTPQNYGEIENLANYAHSRRLGLRLSLIRSALNPSGTVKNEISDELCRLYSEWGAHLDPNLPIFRFSAFAEWNLHVTKHIPCSSCRKFFAVSADGEVATCQMRMNRPYGNLMSEPFADIVSRMQLARENSLLAEPKTRKGTCTSCEFFHVCASGCPQHNIQVSGDADFPSPWCQVYGRVLPEYIRAVANQLLRAVVSTLA